MEELFTITYAVCGFAIVALLFLKGKGSSEQFGALLLFLWFSRFLLLSLKGKLDLSSNSFLLLFDQNLFLLDGVFLYWYVSSFIQKPKLKFMLLGIAPFLLFASLSVITLILIDSEEIYQSYLMAKAKQSSSEVSVKIGEVLFLITIVAVNVIYILKSFILLGKYKKSLLDNLSTLGKMNTDWLFRLMVLWVTFLLIPLISFAVNYIFKGIDTGVMRSVFLIGLIVVSFIFSILVLRLDYAYGLYKEPKSAQLKAVDEELFQLNFDRLNSLMEEKMLYRQSDLTLRKLSEMMELKPSELSQLIKRKNNSNFYEFVNHYRIESVKKDLISTDEQIIIIAYNNGFNSKSTFNTTFKSKTNYTPSRFRKEYKSMK